MVSIKIYENAEYKSTEKKKLDHIFVSELQPFYLSEIPANNYSRETEDQPVAKNWGC